MRLITHNLLICNKKGVVNGYPLRIEAEEIEIVESEFSAPFILKMLPKLNWDAFLNGAQALQLAKDLPTQLTEKDKQDEALLKRIHHVLMEVHVKKGKLICPESGREFPIVDGIANMLLHEDEV